VILPYLKDAKRIAVLSRSALGDLILCLPALLELKRVLKDVEITLFCDSANCELAENLSVFDSVVSIPSRPNRLFHLLRYGRFYSRNNYDAFVCMKVGFGRQGGLFAWALNAKYSCGFVADKSTFGVDGKYYLTDRCFSCPVLLTKECYVNHHYSHVIRQLFFVNEKGVKEYPFGGLALRFPGESKKHSSANGRCQVVVVVGGEADHRKPDQIFVTDLLEWLLKRLPSNVDVVLSGLHADLDRYRDSLFKFNGRVFLGYTETISDLMLLLQESVLIVGGDGGTMHLAALLGKPICMVMSRDSVRKWKPLAKNLCLFEFSQQVEEIDIQEMGQSIVSSFERIQSVENGFRM